MAKQRKRFYVARRNGLYGYQVLSLKYTPAPEVFEYSHTRVSGPYRTLADACEALSRETSMDAIYLGR